MKFMLTFVLDVEPLGIDPAKVSEPRITHAAKKAFDVMTEAVSGAYMSEGHSYRATVETQFQDVTITPVK